MSLRKLPLARLIAGSAISRPMMAGGFISATTTIPVVFGVSEDPVTLGLVASLARPGGNVTGINFFASEIDAKRLGLMHELLPKAKRLAVLINPANPSTADATVKALEDAAPSLGVQLLYFKASTAAEIDLAFAAMLDAKADALFIGPDGYFASRGSQLATLAARDRMPTSGSEREEVAANGLKLDGWIEKWLGSRNGWRRTGIDSVSKAKSHSF